MEENGREEEVEGIQMEGVGKEGGKWRGSRREG